MSLIRSLFGARGRASLAANARAGMGVRMETHYHVVHRDQHGNFLGEWTAENLVVNVGLNDLLDKRFKGSGYTASDWIGLISATPTVAAGDTMASHGGWTEVTDYSGDRKAFTPGSVSSQSVDNSASPAVFTMNGTVTVGGFFLNTDETGTSGILYGGAAFSGGNRAVNSGDTLTVTCTLTAAAA